MKGLQCKELTGIDALTATEVEDPKPGPDEVVIDVKIASVNFPDVLIIQGLYQFRPPLPFVPGGECSGIISSIGDEVKNFAVGDNVFAMTGTGAFAEKLKG